MEKRVSVIIPTYRPGEYIVECVDSVVTQDYNGLIEIILVLNGPKDPYWSILSDLVEKYSNVSIYYNEVGNVSMARNIGIQYATGDYVIFIDDDDYVNSNYISSLVADYDDNSVVIARVYNFIKDKYEKDYLSIPFNKSCKKQTILQAKASMNSVCGKLMPLKHLSNIRFDSSISIGEDAYFMFQLSASIKSVILSNNAIYYRRIRGDSVSHKSYPFKMVLKNRTMLLKRYTVYYIHHIRDINMLFYINRVLSIIKSTYKIL